MKKLTLDEGGSKLKYSSFDGATGMPMQFHNVEALNKSQLKKANKEFYISILSLLPLVSTGSQVLKVY